MYYESDKPDYARLNTLTGYYIDWIEETCAIYNIVYEQIGFVIDYDQIVIDYDQIVIYTSW